MPPVDAGASVATLAATSARETPSKAWFYANRWESELASLLNDLMSVQDELFAFLAEKRQLLVEMDVARLDELEPAGEQLMAATAKLPDRRGELLARAASESRPAAHLRTLAKSLPAAERGRMESAFPRPPSGPACCSARALPTGSSSSAA